MKRPPTAIPWSRPRHELLLLALVAVAALSPVHSVNAQDVSRLCLTRALEHGRVVVDGCIGNNVDRAYRAGHFYSDKAPGMSVLAVPAAEAVGLQPPARWHAIGDLRLWAIRILTSGVAFILCALLVGRVSEGLAPGRGGLALVVFALGTLTAPFAATLFDQVTAGALGFGAFLLAWRGRTGLAGLAAGAAAATEYQGGAIIGVVLAVYVALTGVRPFLRYVAGAVPPLAALAGYNWIAFDSPFHLSYEYNVGVFTGDHTTGFLGFTLPQLKSTYEVFIGSGGLFVVSPVVIAAAGGLVLFGRRHRAEAIACAAVAGLFVLMNCSYHDAYGGLSPGPRYLIPALPFLAMGLGPAFAARPRLVSILTALSVIAITGLTLAWAIGPTYHGTIWAELARVLVHGRGAPIAFWAAHNVVMWVGVGKIGAAVMVFTAAAAAVVLALRPPAR